ncbi:MAG TPA: flagellar hook-basal body complex protein FliE [Thermoleophilaceae bacterium]
MAIPINPSLLAKGPEWQIQSPTATPGQPQGGSNFGGALSQAIQGLSNSQDQAAQAAGSLASGTASDPSSVVMSVERARLAMQLASQIRTKAIEAETDIFHTQV